MHALDVVRRETRAAQYVGFEKMHPVRIADCTERLRREDPHVVDQEIELEERLEHAAAAAGSADVGRDALHSGLRPSAPQPSDGGVQALWRAVIDDDACSLAGGSLSGCSADAGRRAGHECKLRAKSEIHASLPQTLSVVGTLTMDLRKGNRPAARLRVGGGAT